MIISLILMTFVLRSTVILFGEISCQADLIAKYEIYSYIHLYIYIYIYIFFTGKCKSKAQSEFKIVFLIESVLMFCMTCLGFCFRHYSFNLGFSFI